MLIESCLQLILRAILLRFAQGLETETPRMEIGSLKFIGQHQHIIGTSVVIDNSSVQASSSVPEVVAMAKRRIVFRRIAGSINALQSGAVATASSHSNK